VELSSTPIAVFGRTPEAGRAKTRLAPVLGSEGAAALYGGFLEDTLATCVAVKGLEPVLWVAGAPEDPRLDPVVARFELPRARQPEADLGLRMAAALEAAFEARGRGLVIGTDSPTLPRSYLALAAAALDEADVVLGPSADGGYWLVGARRGVAPAQLFAGVTWSAPSTLAETVANAVRLGVTVQNLPPWYDVDTPEDLRLLRAHLSVDRTSAPATARLLGF
jgi:uncharacterized protein